MEYEIRSKAFIIESNRILREVTIVRKNSDFYMFGLTTMAVSSYAKAGSSLPGKLQNSIFQRIIAHLRHLGVNHHISLGIIKR